MSEKQNRAGAALRAHFRREAIRKSGADSIASCELYAVPQVELSDLAWLYIRDEENTMDMAEEARKKDEADPSMVEPATKGQLKDLEKRLIIYGTLGLSIAVAVLLYFLG